MTISASDAPLETHPFFIIFLRQCLRWIQSDEIVGERRFRFQLDSSRLSMKTPSRRVKSNRTAHFSLSQLVPSDSSDFFVTRSSKHALSACRSARRHVARLSAEWKHRLWKHTARSRAALCCELSHLTHLLTVNLFPRSISFSLKRLTSIYSCCPHTEHSCRTFSSQRYLRRRFPNGAALCPWLLREVRQKAILKSAISGCVIEETCVGAISFQRVQHSSFLRFFFFFSSLPYQLGALLLSRWSLVHTQRITEMNHGELQKRAFRIWDGSPAEFVKQASEVVPWRRPFHSERKKKHFTAGWSVSEVFGNKPKSNIISCLLMKPSGELMMTKLN